MEISKKILSIGDMLDGFPSTFAWTIAKPIDQIIKFVVNKFGVEDGATSYSGPTSNSSGAGGGVTRSGIMFAL